MLACLLLSAFPHLCMVPQEPTRGEKFAQDFQKALELREKPDMDRAVRRYTDEAISLFLHKAEIRAVKPDKDISLWVDSFSESWERVHRNDFTRKFDRYVQMMDSARRDARAKLRSGFLPTVNRAHLDALKSRKGSDWVLVRQDALQLAKNFSEVNDLYHEAFAYNILGNAWHPDYTDDDDGDAKKALEGYEGFLNARDRLDLTNDSNYNTVNKLATDLRARLGIADPTTGDVPEKKISRFEMLPAPGADWIEVSMAPSYDKKPSKILHSCDLADESKLNWMITGLGGIDSQVELRGFDPPVLMRRTGRNEFVLDGGAGPTQGFKITPKTTRVEFLRLIDGEEVSHAMAFSGGTEREPIYGRELNFSIHEKGATVFYRSIASRTGETPFGDLTIWDHSGDGQFGYSKLAVVGAVGMPRGDFMYRLDGVMLGKGKTSTPYGRWIQDANGSWYEIKSGDLKQASKISLMPLAAKTGIVSAEVKGVKGLTLESLLLVAETRQIKNLVVNVANKKGVSVPIGRYKILQGIMRGKKGEELMVLPAASLGRVIEVEEGKASKIQLGGKFTLAVKPAESQDQNGKLLLDGQTLHVKGEGGERYIRFVGEPLFETVVEVKGKKKANTEFAKPSGQQMNDDFAYTYYPLDAAIPLLDGLQYRLLIKKHPWFKKLASDWISHP